MGDNPSKSSHWSMEPLLNEGMLTAGLYKSLRVTLVDEDGNYTGTSIPKYDTRTITRDTNSNISIIVYSLSGSTVATLTVTRDGSGNITTLVVS